MPPPLIVFAIPGFALFFFMQMLICEAYHFHVTMTRHKKYSRDGGTKAIEGKDGDGKTQKGGDTGQEKYATKKNPNGENYDDKADLISGQQSEESVPKSTRCSALSDRLKSRRKSVFAESYDPATDDDYEQIVHPKSPEEKKWLSDNLRSITLFQHLAPDQIKTVVDAMYKYPVKKGDIIMKQGEKGNIFFVIQSGVFNVFVQDNNGKEQMMHTYNNQGSFGELALLYNQPRAATIAAASDGVLWAVDGQTFRRIVHKITYEKRVMYESLINNVPMLNKLEPYECANLVDALVPKTYQDKEWIIKQGEKSDGMYFVVSGNVQVVVTTDTGKESPFKKLSDGEYFGELGLLTNKPRAASVISEGQTQLAFLDREAFERLLGPCMDIMKRNIGEYEVELDAIIHDKHGI